MFRHQGFIFLGLLIFYFLSNSTSVAQVTFQHLTLQTSENDENILRQHAQEIAFEHTSDVKAQLNQIITYFQFEGYFTAQVSQLIKKDSLYFAQFVLGERFEWLNLSSGNLPVAIQEKINYRDKFFFKKPFQYAELAELFEKVLTHAENTGFPFASVKLSNISLENNSVKGEINYQSGPYITFGKLILDDSSVVKPDFLASYLEVKSGVAYSEKKVKRVADMLSQLPYLKIKAPAEVSFQNETADLYLEIVSKKSNQFDGLISFLPNQGEENKLLLTGQVNILLNNLFHSGKKLSFDWQKLQVQSQQLTLQYDHPNIAHTGLDAAASFQLLKEDTLYVNRNVQIELSYKVGAYQRVSAFTGIKSSSTTVAEITETNSLSDLPMANFSLKHFGAGYEFKKLNNIQFPKQGFTFAFEGSMGNKSFKSLPGSSEDSTQQMSWQSTLSIYLKNYFSIGRNIVLFSSLSGAALINDNLFLNDLYRVGGFATLRGFNENFFFAQNYAISNLECRLLFEDSENAQSYLFVFYDQAYLSQKNNSAVGHSYPLGLGTGISLTTTGGTFNIAVAAGKSGSQDINFAAAKIHFGYISRF